ncbi:unnamed protein product, partial [Medioppia subpectinata]
MLFAIYHTSEILFVKFSPTYFQYTPLKMSAESAVELFGIGCGVYTVGLVLNIIYSYRFQIETLLTGHGALIVIGHILLIFARNNLTLVYIANCVCAMGISFMYAGIFAMAEHYMNMTDTLASMFFLFRGVFVLTTSFAVGRLQSTQYIECESSCIDTHRYGVQLGRTLGAQPKGRVLGVSDQKSAECNLERNVNGKKQAKQHPHQFTRCLLPIKQFLFQFFHIIIDLIVSISPTTYGFSATVDRTAPIPKDSSNICIMGTLLPLQSSNIQTDEVLAYIEVPNPKTNAQIYSTHRYGDRGMTAAATVKNAKNIAISNCRLIAQNIATCFKRSKK